MAGLHVSELWVYPIKSCRGIALQEAEIGDRGFAGDRRFVVADPQGHFLTQRQLPRMALIEVLLGPEHMILSAPGMAPQEVPLRPEGEAAFVQVWRDRCAALFAGREAKGWLSEFLSVPCQLLYMPEESRRPVDPHYAPEGRLVSFADGCAPRRRGEEARMAT